LLEDLWIPVDIEVWKALRQLGGTSGTPLALHLCFPVLIRTETILKLMPYLLRREGKEGKEREWGRVSRNVPATVITLDVIRTIENERKVERCGPPRFFGEGPTYDLGHQGYQEGTSRTYAAMLPTWYDRA